MYEGGYFSTFLLSPSKQAVRTNKHKRHKRNCRIAQEKKRETGCCQKKPEHRALRNKFTNEKEYEGEKRKRNYFTYAYSKMRIYQMIRRIEIKKCRCKSGQLPQLIFYPKIHSNS